MINFTIKEGMTKPVLGTFQWILKMVGTIKRDKLRMNITYWFNEFYHKMNGKYRIILIVTHNYCDFLLWPYPLTILIASVIIQKLILKRLFEL